VLLGPIAVIGLARAFPGLALLQAIGAVMGVAGVLYAALAGELMRRLVYIALALTGVIVLLIGAGTDAGVAAAQIFAVIIITLAVVFALASADRAVTPLEEETQPARLLDPARLVMVLIAGAAAGFALAWAGQPGLVADLGANLMRPLAQPLSYVLVFALAGSLGALITSQELHSPRPSVRITTTERLTHWLAPAVGVVALFVLGGLQSLQSLEAWSQSADRAGFVIGGASLLALAAVMSTLLRLVRPWRMIPGLPDIDGVDRGIGASFVSWIANVTQVLSKSALAGIYRGAVLPLFQNIADEHGPEGHLARSWPVGFMALWTAGLLAVVLVLIYV